MPSSVFKYFVFLILSVFFLLVFSAQTTPWMNNYGWDSAMFILLGKMFNMGRIPYVDFFDHKGPILIFIEALGLHLSSDNRTGIFLLQCINLFITQFLIYKIARYFSLSSLLSFSVVLLSLLMFSFTIQGGNNCEEWSLPYLYLGLFLTISIDNNISIKRYRYIFILGISAAVLFWIRANNMGVVCACFMYLFILTAIKCDIKDLCFICIAFILGFLSISISLIIYFISIDALPEMIYSSLLFNMQYVEYSDYKIPLTITSFIKGWGSWLVLLIGGVVFYLKKRDFRILVGAFSLLFMAIISTRLGPVYFHYMTLNLPLFTVGIVFLFLSVNRLFQSNKNQLMISIICLLAVSIYTFAKKNETQYKQDHDDTEFIQNALDIASKIPMKERQSVFGYTAPIRFWLITDITPSCRFFASQEWHALHDKRILVAVNDFMKEDKPLWVILPTDFKEEDSSNPQFFGILENEYSEVYKNTDLRLYNRYK